ncbi:MAG: TIGR04282 family arsenosugar biosynthesis glycosyltransferase [Magnetococcus sp. YQC-3]
MDRHGPPCPALSVSGTKAEPIRIILFAKAPWPGFAKSRLIPLLGPEGAAALAHRLLDMTLASAVAAGLGPVELSVTPAIGAPAWAGVRIPEGVIVTTQGEGDLGERFIQTASGYRGAMLWIGTDCLEMSPALLREAARALQTTDAVIHPTVDGGYALLGLRQFYPQLFTGMAWSTATVAAESIRRIRQLGCSLHIGACLHDLDEPADLLALDAPTVARLLGKEGVCSLDPAG